MTTFNLRILNSGSTLLATSTPTASTIPVTDANGTLNSFLPTQSVTATANAIPLADGNGTLAAWGLAKNNLGASADPTTTSDTSLGYSTGSLWVNISTGLYWVCANASKGSAEWNLVGQDPQAAAFGALQTFNGQRTYFLGKYQDYTGSLTPVASQIYYYRNWLNVGTVISSMECGAIAVATGSVNLGIYSESGTAPSTRLAQTGTFAPAALPNIFVPHLLSGGSWTVPSSGYYWFAFMTNSATTFSASANVRGGAMITRMFRQEAGSGTTLPATATPTTGNAATIYVAAVE